MMDFNVICETLVACKDYVTNLKIKVTIQTYAVWVGYCLYSCLRFDCKVNVSFFYLHGPSFVSSI